MHVIVYFGVCKCYVCSQLCNWMFNLVMQSCPYKYICCCSVDRAYMNGLQTKQITSHTLKLRNASVMISSIADNCLPASVCPQHTRVISRNRLCCYRSSQTFWITNLFAAYHTHLVKFNRFCCFHSTQIVHLSELYMPYIAHTLIWLTVFVVLANHKQFI